RHSMVTDGHPGASLRRGLNWNRFLAAGFLTLSALDLLVTRYLLTTPGACFYEANPLAERILKSAGWWGLALFKVACAATGVGASALLAPRRPWAARAVLAGAVPVVFLVVGYSLCLAGASDRSAITAAQKRHQMLELQDRDRLAYQEKLSQVAGEVLERRQTL